MPHLKMHTVERRLQMSSSTDMMTDNVTLVVRDVDNETVSLSWTMTLEQATQVQSQLEGALHRDNAK
jgi:hypothetical protein